MKLDLTKFEAVIFDMDGTMVENTAFHNKAWAELCRRHGLNLNEEQVYEKTSGKRNDAILEILFEREIDSEESEKLAEEKEEIYRQLYKPHFKEVNGLKNFLNNLEEKGIKVGVATTSPLKNRIFLLETLQLQDFFTVVVGAEHTKQGKPHPEIYLKAAKELETSPNKCLAFEDTKSGIKSAKSAGMTVVGVLTTHTKGELKEADYWIRDFTEIKI